MGTKRSFTTTLATALAAAAGSNAYGTALAPLLGGGRPFTGSTLSRADRRRRKVRNQMQAESRRRNRPNKQRVSRRMRRRSKGTA